MKALIIGGNRFFGKKLAKLLLSEGADVTLLNRGNVTDGLGDGVSRIKCDRTDKKSLQNALNDTHWDVVYDQVCYDHKSATEACEVFAGKTDKYIFTSSQSVYEAGPNLVEEDFDPVTHIFGEFRDVYTDYAEGKKQAEAGFAKNAKFSVTMVRFPIVIGEDDPTSRIGFHINRIKEGKPIYFPNINAKISFISPEFAAKALSELGKMDFSGPINVASPCPVKLSDFIMLLEKNIGKDALLVAEESVENYSPYGITEDWFMNTNKLQQMGVSIPKIEKWISEIQT